MSKVKYSAEEVVLEVMRHFGYRRNYQVAEYFDVTPQTLSGWIKSGEIPLRHLVKFNEEILPIINKETLIIVATNKLTLMYFLIIKL